jgi:superfamily I DNA and/or RNA helicase
MFRELWRPSTGLFLVTHTERESKGTNELEVQLVERILSCAGDLGPASVAIVTPHRAQRTLLQTRLSRFTNMVDVIDTVERLQGGERPNVIFSATVSDPVAIAENVEFILNLNRSNVAFSRAKNRLIVVCSRELLDFIPAELEYYEETILWKTLRQICNRTIGVFTMDTIDVNVTQL